MQKQGSTSLTPTPRSPWSPVLVTVLAFLLPPGGAVLAVKSLARMRDSDPAYTARQIALTVLVFSVGYGTLMALSLTRGQGPNEGSGGPGISTVVSVGTAIACYLMLGPTYASWRRGNPAVPSGSWLSGVGNALLFTLVTFFGMILVGLLAAIIGAVAGWPAYRLPRVS